ncbi:MAG: TRAP transporter small permease [Chloroflexi bacterium]|nr:TRAP transporter small permease [Chloroflexota bacterium]
MKGATHTLGHIVSMVSGHISAWLVLIMMVMVVVEVITRYLLRSPLMIADEFGGYMLVAVAIIGLAYTWKEKGHIRIDVLTTRLPARARSWLRLVTLVAATAFVPLLIKASFDLWYFSHSRGLKSNTVLLTPLEWPRLVLLVGSILLFLVLIVDLVQAITILRTPGGKLDDL